MTTEQATTYSVFMTFGTGYKIDEHDVLNDIREALDKSNGQLVDSYAPVGPWDAQVIADFKTNEDARKFRYLLQSLGMWKIEATPTGSLASLNKIVESKHATTRR
jgi:hypothetical protein